MFVSVPLLRGCMFLCLFLAMSVSSLPVGNEFNRRSGKVNKRAHIKFKPEVGGIVATGFWGG
ncbi:hypothetical protein CROQUDRAFT_666335, partial [Cronartium quercuum f. sp. fusiforme G11]